MSGVELVRREIIRRLQEGGLLAEAAYDREMAGAYAQAVIAVGIRSCGTAESGLGSYLGETYDEETAAWRAQYGRKLELVVALDAYSPAGAGQEGCCAALERAHDLLTGQPVSGLRFGEMDWGEVRFDRDTGMFLRQGSLRCSAFLVAAVEEESGLLLDFRLKGVPLL